MQHCTDSRASTFPSFRHVTIIPHLRPNYTSCGTLSRSVSKIQLNATVACCGRLLRTNNVSDMVVASRRIGLPGYVKHMVLTDGTLLMDPVEDG